jgi:hypothetical protein
MLWSIFCSAELLLCVRETDGHLAVRRTSSFELLSIRGALRLRSRAMLVREGIPQIVADTAVDEKLLL